MNFDHLEHIFKDYYPFELLSDVDLQTLVTNSEQISFKKNEFLFREDEPTSDLDLYFLVSGLAKNILHQNNGKQLSLRYYYPGDIIGLMVMFTSGELNFSVQALENCTVFKLNKTYFFDIMVKNQQFSKVIWESIGDKMKSFYNEIKNKPQAEDQNINILRTRVKSKMETPTFISPDESMKSAAQMLIENKLDGLIVSKDEKSILGVLTQSEILNYVSHSSIEEKVEGWYKTDYVSITPDSFNYEALSLLKLEHMHYLPVLQNQKVIGTISPRSLLSFHNSRYLYFLSNLHNTLDIDELMHLGGNASPMLQSFIQELLEHESLSYEMTEVISNHNDRLQQQCIKLVEAEMKNEGYGKPPVNYCFIIMGSQARQEQGFNTDQDNGLIIDDFDHLPNANTIRTYFNEFTTKINSRLQEIGFPECPGGIMAKEIKWRKTLSQWKQSIQAWKTEMDAEEIQSFTMFYDFRPIYGDFSLSEEMRSFLVDKVKGSNLLQYLLVKDSLRYKLPVNPLGFIKIFQKNKTIDVKKVGLIQIINTVRIYAIKYGIKEGSTVKRLNRLKELGVMHPRDVENTKTAFHFLLLFRLINNLSQFSKGVSPSNIIYLDDLTKEEKWKLKEALQIAIKMQQATKLILNRTRGV